MASGVAVFLPKRRKHRLWLVYNVMIFVIRDIWSNAKSILKEGCYYRSIGILICIGMLAGQDLLHGAAKWWASVKK